MKTEKETIEYIDSILSPGMKSGIVVTDVICAGCSFDPRDSRGRMTEQISRLEQDRYQRAELVRAVHSRWRGSCKDGILRVTYSTACVMPVTPDVPSTESNQTLDIRLSKAPADVPKDR